MNRQDAKDAKKRKREKEQKEGKSTWRSGAALFSAPLFSLPFLGVLAVHSVGVP
ncbi:MAG TPA: hypothetical protein VMG10_13755 [Gemmataceae bacterium]|nr:hypothetical protein [Gemmataceae bacterium]